MTVIDSPRDVSYWRRELQELATEHGSTAGEAEVSRNTIYKWTAEDPIFHKCKEMAKEAFSDLLVAEMTRRGRDGNVVKVYDKYGVEVGEERKYSDYLIAFALKGLDSGSRWTQRQEAGAKEGAWRADIIRALSDPKKREALERFADAMADKEAQP
jgi:hypothetical protein